jgi:hypothetical protein
MSKPQLLLRNTGNELPLPPTTHLYQFDKGFMFNHNAIMLNLIAVQSNARIDFI